MESHDAFRIQSTGRDALVVTQAGPVWFARLDDPLAKHAEVPVTLAGLRRALSGHPESFVGRSSGLTLRTVGSELKATFWPMEGTPTTMTVDRDAMRKTLDALEPAAAAGRT